MEGEYIGKLRDSYHRSDPGDRTVIDAVSWELFNNERDVSKHMDYYSRLLLLGAEPSGKAISDTGIARDRLILQTWKFPSITFNLVISPLSVVSALARDEDTAEGSPSKKSKTRHVQQ